ncbi:MAG: hypothetical protein ABGY71_10135 [bacterium]
MPTLVQMCKCNKAYTTKRFALLAPMIASLASLAAAQANMGEELTNLRFSDSKRNLTLIGPDNPVPGLVQGTLSGEVAFLSDQVNSDSGEYTCPELAILWSLEGKDGFVHFSNTSTPGWQWLGQSLSAVVLVPDFDNTTGAGTATLRIPVGLSLAETGAISSRTHYPHMPEHATLSVLLGWKTELRISDMGLPEGTLAVYTQQVPVQWPEAWVVADDFVNQVGVDSEPRSLTICMNHRARTDRTLRVIVEPDHRASLESAVITVPAGAFVATARFVALSPGDIRFSFFEDKDFPNGALVARSDEFHIVPLLFIGEVGSETGFAHGGVDGPTAMLKSEFEPGDSDPTKLCVPGTSPGGPADPVRVLCNPCGGSRVCAGDHAPGTAAPPVTLYTPDACIGDPGPCNLFLTPRYDLPVYRFRESKEKVCKTISGTAHLQGGIGIIGGGGSTSWTIYKYETCCKYDLDANADSGEQSSNFKCGR